MKKLWSENRVIIGVFILWELLLLAIEKLLAPLIPLRMGFLGPSPWANLDGVHYLSISEHGYYQYEQAFFPFYPSLIKALAEFFNISHLASGLLISHLSIFIVFMLLFRSNKLAGLFLLLFPTSFYFASVYNESLFLLLALITYFATYRRIWWLAGIAGGLASATRLFGLFLLIPVVWEYFALKKKRLLDFFWLLLIPSGFLLYAVYLNQTLGDPLAFFHVQPAFGANRSTSLILLPQVLWRYWRIFVSVSWFSLSWNVAMLELTSLLAGLSLVWFGFRPACRLPAGRQGQVGQKIHPGWLVYSLAVLLLPALTGTLTSLPRYFLSAFPLFFVLGKLHNRPIKVTIAIVFFVGLVFSTAYFLRGYFIA